MNQVWTVFNDWRWISISLDISSILISLGILVFVWRKVSNALSVRSRYVKDRIVELKNWVDDNIFHSLNNKSSGLTPGWRLVSLHHIGPCTPIESAFQYNPRVQLLLTYDPRDAGGWLSASRGTYGMFEGTLRTINPGLGYWIFHESIHLDHPIISKYSSSEILFDVEPLSTGWNLVSGWTLIVQRGEDPVDTDINSMFAGDDTVRRVATYNPCNGVWSRMVLWIRRFISMIRGKALLSDLREADDLLWASRGDDGKFIGLLDTIKPELGYWVYKESTEEPTERMRRPL